MVHRRLGLALLLMLAAAPVAAAPAEDGYIEGYAAAILQREFSLNVPSLRVRHGVITLDAADLAAVDQAQVVAQLERIPGVARVEVRPPGAPPLPLSPPPRPSAPPQVISEWQVGLLPGNALFKPLIADPRWPHFSASYQYYVDDPQLKNVASATFGESFALYRGKLGPGWWEVGVHAGVFSVFDLDAASFDLVNADYMVGLPLSVRFGDFSAMLRLSHQSSHLGDEFLLRTSTNRINLSYESVDLMLSYEFFDVVRLYGGEQLSLPQGTGEPRSVLRRHGTGVELTSPWPARRRGGGRSPRSTSSTTRKTRGTPTSRCAPAFRSRACSSTRKLQILFEYFNGQSPNGQFYTNRIQYFGIGTHFHF